MKVKTTTIILLALLGVSCGNPEPSPPPAPAPPPSPLEEIQEEKRVFTSPLAGSWYDADPARLRRDIQGWLDKIETAPLAGVQALLLPHAGYRYSGPTAAFGIKQVAGKTFRRVIVMGPSHRLPLSKMASVPDVTHYATPLGEVPLDTAFIKKLMEHDCFQSIPHAHDREHSVQIEIPLLQHALKDFLLVPVVVGDQDRASAERIARILLRLIDKDTLIVASSDFTHYGTNYRYVPFSEDVENNIKRLDMGAFEFIRSRDIDGFYGYCGKTGATICGRQPIAVLLAMLPNDSEAHLLHYDTSGRIMNDFNNSVSYLTVAFTGEWPAAPPSRTESPGPSPLSKEDKDTLIKLARRTLDYFFEHQAVPSLQDLGIEITPSMKSVSGAFVTLNKGGQLRGCIGNIYPAQPLYEAVMLNALRAALQDQRFPQVSREELARISLEISVLTPPHPVDSYRDIVIGQHGIVLTKNGRSAVFLPQVAPQQNWTLDETLTHLARKAQLPADGWREGARFKVFEAIVFGEEPT